MDIRIHGVTEITTSQIERLGEFMSFVKTLRIKTKDEEHLKLIMFSDFGNNLNIKKEI